MSTNPLEEIYYLFDPDTTAFDADFFEKYYVEIEHGEANINELKTSLELSLKNRKPTKILFTGHSGSGKTTALHRLISKLGDKFFIIEYSAFDIFDINDVSYTDVLLSMLSKLLERIDDIGLNLDDKLKKRIKAWGSSIEEIYIDDKNKNIEIGLEIPLLFAKIMGRIKNETTSRTTIRKNIESKVSELIAIINDIIDEVEKSTDQQVLILIDNLEKTDPEKANEIFYLHGTQLVQPRCKIIYTFPIALKYSEKFTQIEKTFTKVYLHPNIKIQDKDGNLYYGGINLLKEIVNKRTALEFIEKEALDYTIENSGGIIRELIRIIRDSTNRAIAQGKKIIDKEIAISVVNDMKNLYRGQLSEEDYQKLAEICNSKELKRDEGLVRLLHNLSVLEYRNGTFWCDVNPIVKSLLKERKLTKK